MDTYIIAIAIYMASIFWARHINTTANKKLDQEKKAMLVDLVSNKSVLNYILLMGVLMALYFALKYNVYTPWVVYLFFNAIVVMYVVVTGRNTYIKLTEAGFPADYIRSYLMSTGIKILGMMIFALVFVQGI